MGKARSKGKKAEPSGTIKAGAVNGVIVQDGLGEKLYLLREETPEGPRTKVTLGNPYSANYLTLSDAALRGLVTAVRKLLVASR